MFIFISMFIFMFMFMLIFTQHYHAKWAKWKYCMDMQHFQHFLVRFRFIFVLIFMFVFMLMFTHYVDAACSCEMSLQHGHAARTCNMETWTCSMETWKCSMETWTCSMEIWTWSMDETKAKTCTIGMQKLDM
jgi:hypothetical protein